MKTTGKYSINSFCDYDIDHEINAAVTQQKELIEEVKGVAKDSNDAKLMLKAMLTEILENI